MESTMSTINKELYDALIEAKVGEDTATNAARSVQGQEQNKRLDNIDKRLIVVETKLDTVSVQVNGHNERLDDIERRLTVVETKLDAVSAQINGHNKRLDNIERRLTVVENKLDTTNRLIWIVIAGVAGILVKTLLV